MTKNDTAARIVDTAERLWGERGIAGVSLRQITTAIDRSFPGLVQYHFGGRDGLIRAIIISRMLIIEARRRELLDSALASGTAPDVKTLLDCLLRPQLELVDADGLHRYAAFLRQLLMSNDVLSLRAETMAETPISQQLVDLLQAAMPPMPDFFLRRRLINANLIFADYLVRLDHEHLWNPEFSVTDEIVHEEALGVIAAAMTAETPKQGGRHRPQDEAAGAI